MVIWFEALLPPLFHHAQNLGLRFDRTSEKSRSLIFAATMKSFSVRPPVPPVSHTSSGELALQETIVAATC